jgi:hypothetical protein
LYFFSQNVLQLCSLKRLPSCTMGAGRTICGKLQFQYLFENSLGILIWSLVSLVGHLRRMFDTGISLIFNSFNVFKSFFSNLKNVNKTDFSQILHFSLIKNFLLMNHLFLITIVDWFLLFFIGNTLNSAKNSWKGNSFWCNFQVDF